MKMANCTTQIKLKNVLLATDLSEASLHATRYAISLAARYGGRLYAAHVISLDAFVLAHPEAVDRILKETNDYTKCTLDELLAPVRRQAVQPQVSPGSDRNHRLRGLTVHGLRRHRNCPAAVARRTPTATSRKSSGPTAAKQARSSGKRFAARRTFCQCG
jgi:nucleotide-binding universal stress UspA family protein